jgi:hypothetical protein
MAVCKAVLSGDTVVLANPNACADGSTPEALFTLANVVCPRLGSARAGTVDEPGAHASRMFLRQLLIGQTVKFDVARATADRYYGVLYKKDGEEVLNANVESVRSGHSSPKGDGKGDKGSDDPDGLDAKLAEALVAAKQNNAGIQGADLLVRSLTTAGEQFGNDELCRWVQAATDKRVKVLIEHCFDGSRMRCLVTDDRCPHIYGSFVLQLAGLSSPRPAEPYHAHSKHFVDCRLLNRELEVTLFGADKSGQACVGELHHPMGNISLLLLKSGLAKIREDSMRMLNPADVPGYRASETFAKNGG